MKMGRAWIAVLSVIVLLITSCHHTERPQDSEMPSATVASDDGTPTRVLAVSPERALDVPALSQYPELPTGCEATAAAMVLQYCGEDISPTVFAAQWLMCDGNFLWQEGEVYGPDPNEVFVGDPFSEASYGCYATPIVDAINRNSVCCTARLMEGETLASLCKRYIDSGQPVLVWATMEMRVSKAGDTWILPSGDSFTWIAGEHCLVLVGYDDECYYFNDPRAGKTVAYEKTVSQQRFEELGSQAVLITT